MDELSWLLTVYELAFLLFWVKEAAQVEDDGQKEHEAGDGDDRHCLRTGDGAVEAFTPESVRRVHLEQNATRRKLNTWQHVIRPSDRIGDNEQGPVTSFISRSGL